MELDLFEVTIGERTELVVAESMEMALSIYKDIRVDNCRLAGEYVEVVFPREDQ